MRSTTREGELLEVESSRNTTTANNTLMSKESIAGSNDSVPSTHCSDEESHATNWKYTGEDGVEIVSIRRVSSNKDESEKSVIDPIRKENSKLFKKESFEPSRKESSKTSQTNKKQLFRGLFGSKRGKEKSPSRQCQNLAASTKKAPKLKSQQMKKELAPTMKEKIPGPSTILRQVSISVEIRPSINDEIESPKVDPGAENEDDLADEPLLERIVTASDLAKVPAQEAPTFAKAGEMSAKSDTNLSGVENTKVKAENVSASSDPVLGTVENTEAKEIEVTAESYSVLSSMENMSSPNRTIENVADGTKKSVGAVKKNPPIVFEQVAPIAKKVNILDTAGMKVDALVDAFFLLTSCGRIDSMCYGMETDSSIDGDTLRRILSDDCHTFRSDTDDDDTLVTLDNSLLEDDETLRTFLEDDGTFCADDDTLRQSEEVRRAIVTLKRYASRLRVSEAELLQRIRDEQEKRKTDSTQESPPADDI
jgi:hypothetical protein